MNVSVTIYKEKKEKDFRMVILPSGRNKIGLGQYKDYGIISYLNKKDSKKIGEFLYWALNESDNEEIEDEVNIQWCKKYFNRSSDLKVVNEYNNIDFDFFENKYSLMLNKKDGRGYSPFKDENKEAVNNWCNTCLGTVHKFQGKEANSVILLLGCDNNSKSSAQWAAQAANILNVAATRAKKRFTIIGDLELWGKLNFFKDAKEVLDKFNKE